MKALCVLLVVLMVGVLLVGLSVGCESQGVVGGCDVSVQQDGELVYSCGFELGHGGPHQQGVKTDEADKGMDADGGSGRGGGGQSWHDAGGDTGAASGCRPPLPVDRPIQGVDDAGTSGRVGPGRIESRSSSVKGLTPMDAIRGEIQTQKTRYLPVFLVAGRSASLPGRAYLSGRSGPDHGRGEKHGPEPDMVWQAGRG